MEIHEEINVMLHKAIKSESIKQLERVVVVAMGFNITSELVTTAETLLTELLDEKAEQEAADLKSQQVLFIFHRFSCLYT